MPAEMFTIYVPNRDHWVICSARPRAVALNPLTCVPHFTQTVPARWSLGGEVALKKRKKKKNHEIKDQLTGIHLKGCYALRVRRYGHRQRWRTESERKAIL